MMPSPQDIANTLKASLEESGAKVTISQKEDCALIVADYPDSQYKIWVSEGFVRGMRAAIADEVIRLRAEKKSLRAIAKAVGCNHQTVANVLATFGLR